MLKGRYSKIKMSNKDYSQISLEIMLFHKLSVHTEKQKDYISAYLKYCDEEFMYFPCP